MAPRFKSSVPLVVGLKLIAVIAGTELIIMLIAGWINVQQWFTPTQFDFIDTAILSITASFVIFYWVIKRLEASSKTIEEYKSLEKMLLASEHQYRNLFENNPQPMFIYDRETLSIFVVNNAAVDQYGYSRVEFLAMTVKDLHRPEEHAAVVASIAQLTGEIRRPGVWRHKKKDGTLFDADIVTYDMVFNGMKARHVLINDVTEQHKSEKDLRTALHKVADEKARSEAIIAAIGDGITIQNREFRIIYQNDIARNLMGNHVGGYCYSAYEGMEHTCEGCPVALSFEDGKIHTSVRSVHTDKGTMYFENTASTLRDADGKIIAGIEVVRDISERKRTEAEKEQFYKFFQTSTDLMVIADPNGAFMKTNPACTETLGYSETELVSKPFIEFIHPEDKQATLDEMARQLQKGFSLNFENRYICKDGSFRWLSWRAIYNKEDNRTYATARDITERKRTEDALRKSEKFIENILSSVDEAFVVIDREYRIIAANRAYCEEAGMSWEKVIGSHCYEVSHHASQPCQEPDHVCAFKHTLETGEPAFTVHTHTDEKGKQRQADIRTYAMKDESGEIQSVIEVIIDVTEKKALENQLRHAQKMESIGTLAGGIAHDFNNILSAIIGYGHITLMKMPTDDPLRLNIEHMLESADRAAALTKSLLTFSRKQIINRKPIDMNNLLTKLEKFLVRVIGEDVMVQLVIHEGELTVMADEGQLEQVFMNLATNARDAMPHGGLFMIETSIMEMDREFVSTHPFGKPGTYAVISVTDTGVGMSEETIKKIFEPFFTTKEIGKGTGLGLAMVYGILKQNEGFIDVFSEPSKGTTFRIYLPLIKTTGMEGQKSVDISYPKGGTETILLAEDDEHLRQLIVVVLEQMGYTVITADNGDDAVAKFKMNKDRIQLLLFDLMMPKKSGIEAYDEIRKVMPKVPVLFASGYSSDMLFEKALIEEGAIVISKPMSPQNLLKKVREVLDRGNQVDNYEK